MGEVCWHDTTATLQNMSTAHAVRGPPPGTGPRFQRPALNQKKTDWSAECSQNGLPYVTERDPTLLFCSLARKALKSDKSRL